MRDKSLKTIIIIWLMIMCSMDHFALRTWQTRTLLWGVNALLFTIWITKNISQKRGFVPIQEKGIQVVLYLFLFWVCLSIFFSHDPACGVKRMAHILIALLNSYIFYDFLARSKESLQFFRKAITFFTVFVSCWAMQEALQRLIRGRGLFKGINAGFCNSNFLGYFLFLFFPLILSYYLINSPFHGKYRIWRLVLVSLVGYALVLSSSRSSWNGFIFALIFLLFQKNKARTKGVLFAAVILGLSVYVLRGGEVYQSLWQAVNEDRPVWDAYWNTAMENPLFGIGWGVNPPGLTHGHNIFLSDAVQAGIFSVFLVLAFYALLIHGSLQTAREIQDPHLKAILLGSTATFFGHIAYNLTDSGGILAYFMATTISFFPYMLLAVPFAVSYIHRQQTLQTGHMAERKIPAVTYCKTAN